ncbi:TadE-like protein [Actinokineospora alba]|uniref:TadE-like protein n=1 Tax=Actinokineospora alba TaxID=504798 RepID=A0A1H0SYW2_9PSEU|nr:TadE family type IV pilus minor pilin [Actinokineospora alba]TDP66460.1 TadE-like protein [Actinokineospora alba]SDJ52163.1 TadE-like protein [Actinokineospora alba]SDP46993.1 TadE-like protein [Actinokineospora alba]
MTSDRGAATVEAAIIMVALMVVLTLVVGALMAVTDQMRCTDAAREAARLAARGEVDRGRTVAAGLAPRGADILIRRDGDAVSVEVHADALGGIHLQADAHVIAEPGTSA